ncbi:diguanylate cyclase [Thermosipho melanesiensis]|uniref:GAF domain-containing protein-like protein n=2 Tax=Thermosipho melanesiensis TaxID=46541 RepID=A6LMS7_THEM4|nr:GAF domain-containing protein [Thermosipho melanesiensis]ABR31228.1 GAF domain-containing protein-like protein [Thermosipho melanesiensis BI429]APT74312.1 histidine kinase [Thermosipho melanesiensis]OOC36253.1 diguanylate cyclase [Thermosipho melanesiensis]OOC37071.1 diguanylate cyclase [Thermosipho melanesiensis]OOC37823.1 diguanylate cyclase [Thermosipho melanesiensis]
MRNIVENHVEELLEILKYDKSQWQTVWDDLKNRFKVLKKLEEKFGKPDFENLERRKLDKFLNDFRVLANNKDSVATKIREHSNEFELQKEDFIVFLGFYPKEIDWIVMERKDTSIIFENIYSLWLKNKIDKISDAVFQSVVHFKNGEKEGNFYDKDEIFEEILMELNSVDDESYMRKACEILYDKIPYYNWVGFYMINDEGLLELYDFVGEPTEHVKIKIGEGICGQAANLKRTFIVQDVSKETNYLSCSPKVKSEIVVPIFNNSEVIGELDIDSHYISPFDLRDDQFLKKICIRVSEIWKNKY